jgi:hypothetical protein
MNTNQKPPHPGSKWMAVVSATLWVLFGLYTLLLAVIAFRPLTIIGTETSAKRP